MKRYEIAALKRNARSVSSDPVVEQNILNDLLPYAHPAGEQLARVLLPFPTNLGKAATARSHSF
jgi:hypothetical protein